MSRLFVGNIGDATREDLAAKFEPLGELADVRVMRGYAFVEYASAEAAEKAVAELNETDLLGQPVVVQVAKPRGEERRQRVEGPPEPRYRVEVLNVPEGVAWQDLKDFGRQAGNVKYSNVIHSRQLGILEYDSQESADEALRVLATTPLNDVAVEVRSAPTESFVPRGGRGGFRGGFRGRGRGDGFRGRGGGRGWGGRGGGRGGDWADRSARRDDAAERPPPTEYDAPSADSGW